MTVSVLCHICEQPGEEARPDSSPGVCMVCYAKGWRTGAEMDSAFAADPELTIDGEGKVGLRRHEVGVPYPPSASGLEGEA
jgi:hypothetical protein